MKRWLSLSLVVLLAGCVKYQPKPISPAETESSFRSRSVNDPKLQAFVQRNLTNPPDSWPPAEFNLESLTLVAFYFHPDIELARAQLATAQAGEVVAGARPNPTVSFLPEYSINPDAGVSPWVLGFSWDIPVETAGKRGYRIAEAKQATQSAKLALGEAAWKVRSRLRAALVEYFAARNDVEALRHENDLHHQLTDILQTRLKLGEASRIEVNQEETDALNTIIALGKSETRLADAEMGLASALGLPKTALESIHVTWPQFESLPPEDEINVTNAQTAGLLNRLDVRRALTDYAVAEADLQSEIAKQYPDVHLTPGYQFDQGQHKFSIGPTLDLPIFDQNKGGIAQSRAKRDEAAATFLSTQSQAIMETEKAIVDYRASLEAWKQADRFANDLQGRIEKSTELQLKLGEADRLALLTVQVQKSAAMRARLDALKEAQSALGALEDALQRPV
ncbi:MAG TPA: TolC family protein, partial [Verrucomicrobiae bacterium]|nr:TolC family protein [Verrucomicrobiae bacterium]